MKKLITILTAALLTVANSQAAVFLWNNSGSAWTSGTSWTNGVQPSSTSSSTTTDEIQFGNYGANFNTVDLTSSRSAKNITFLTNANTYTLTTSSAKILTTSAGITNNSTAIQTFNLAVENANASNTWYSTSGGTLVFNNVVTMTSGSSATSRTVTLAGGGTFTFNAAVNNGGTATAGKLSINNAGGTVNLNAANTLGGGVQITAGTVNISNAGALGTGIVELGSTTGTSYGNSILNNSSGSALTLTGITGILWSGTTPAGVQIGTSASTAANNIDFGSGLVTTTTSRSMNIAGNGVTVSMGILTTTGTSNGYVFTFDGTGNTIDLDGWRISTAVSPIQNVVHQLKGTANLTVGTIENGTAGWNNGIEINSGGTNRLTGNNTYTGTTSFMFGTNIISGNNSAATNSVSVAGTSGSTKTPLVRLDSQNAISAASTILGSSSTTTMGTIDFNGSTNYTLNNLGGGNMTFTASYAQPVTVTFTNANNILTSSAGSSGGRSLYNNKDNLLIILNGGLDIGSTSSGVTNIIGGVGTWDIKGAVVNNAVGSTRALRKTGTGTLILEGANNYNGDTDILDGTLQLLSTGSLTNSTVQVNGGTFDLRGTAGSINLNTGTLDVRGSSGLLTQAAGSALVRAGGTIGNSTVGGGTLLIEGTAGDTTVNSGTVTVNSSGVMGNATVNSLLYVNGTAGNIAINTGGTLGGSGTVGAITLNGGTVSPGNSPGLLTATSLDASNGNLLFQLGAPTTRGTTYDAIDVSNLLTLASGTTWTFQVDGGYSFQMNDSYDLFNWGTLDSTTFDSNTLLVALPDLDTVNSNLAWDVNSFTTDGTVMVIPEPDTAALLFLGLAGLIGTRIYNRRK